MKSDTLVKNKKGNSTYSVYFLEICSGLVILKIQKNPAIWGFYDFSSHTYLIIELLLYDKYCTEQCSDMCCVRVWYGLIFYILGVISIIKY